MIKKILLILIAILLLPSCTNNDKVDSKTPKTDGNSISLESGIDFNSVLTVEDGSSDNDVIIDGSTTEVSGNDILKNGTINEINGSLSPVKAE